MAAPRRRFGQNFLQDAGVIDDIIAAVDPQPGERIVEIGPGRGALTNPLLDEGVELTVIEIDRDLASNWAARARQTANLRVIERDALHVSAEELSPDGLPIRLVGNLPYNISTPLLFKFCDWTATLVDLHLMLQKEVVDRMSASPGSRTYGRLTVMLAPHFAVEPLLTVPGSAFFPAPKVTSAVARLTPRHVPPFELTDVPEWEDVVAAGFSLRRKTLRNALRKLLDEDEIAMAGVDPGARAETLSPDRFAALAAVLADKRQQAD
ncbi:MAG: 16S rRNA (adenine(1518)-N(6)/adenine(1519)-N(6))-dimethyltransferase RsmA [Pseudomonadota bacterium]